MTGDFPSPFAPPPPPDGAPAVTGAAIARLAAQGAMIKAKARCVACSWRSEVAVPIGTGPLPCPGCAAPDSVVFCPVAHIRFLPVA